MTGEGFALLAALSYGLAGVTIVRGKASARGDNGVFLSVVLTAAVSGALWLGWGQVRLAAVASLDAVEPIAVFLAAGLFSMVLGRTTMYRATEQIGPVAASLLRRLTPVIALPIGVVFLAEFPAAQTYFGAGLVIAGVMLHIGRPARTPGDGPGLGWLLGVGSAAFYAVSYVLRSHGLDQLPDAAFGTFIGALAGLAWMMGAALTRAGGPARLRRLLTDRGPWHWLTAAALSAGQIFQFFALKSAPVVVVATLGSLEVFFTALLGVVLIGAGAVTARRIWLPALLAVAGTVLLMS
ncbi:DMT family transporter [Roseovarius sp. SCSIO 43702]|uniref:DMT family transporter n=1 Tax=Roseovarius sp. SCSIO 43702 TaxID=2823043 RepID=UPI001C734CCC|nr:DMT family transporter [Roseovarius sp. SCSIO 43702]QYX56537.1 DMT family transporter [Roseovarius sp. SCSIO 43702]